MKQKLRTPALIVFSLLVAGAIAAILYPVFVQSEIRCHPITGLSNIKQISTGTLIYLGDYDDRYPTATAMPGLRASLYPYIKNESLFLGEESKWGDGQFNFNLAGAHLGDLPIGQRDPFPPEQTTMWYSLGQEKNAGRAIQAREDGSVKNVPLAVGLDSFRWQYPRDAKTLQPADYMADQDPLKK